MHENVDLGVFVIENQVEAYDHYLDKWTYMPNLTEEKFCHGSVAFGNKLHVIAGLNTQRCEAYDKF